MFDHWTLTSFLERIIQTKQNKMSNMAKHNWRSLDMLWALEHELEFLIDRVEKVHSRKPGQHEQRPKRRWQRREKEVRQECWHETWDQVVIWSGLFIQTKCLEHWGNYLYISSWKYILLKLMCFALARNLFHFWLWMSVCHFRWVGQS